MVSAIQPINNGAVRINGGFFIFKKKIFHYIGEKEELVSQSFQKSAEERQLIGYRYDGFWASMDMFKDKQRLESLWRSGAALGESGKRTTIVFENATATGETLCIL